MSDDGTLDLDDGPSGTGQRASQADSVAAGAFESYHDAGPGACSAIHARASEKPDALLGMVKVAIVAPFGARAKAAPARVEPPSGLSVTGHVPRYPLPWRSRRPPHTEPKPSERRCPDPDPRHRDDRATVVLRCGGHGHDCGIPPPVVSPAETPPDGVWREFDWRTRGYETETTDARGRVHDSELIVLYRFDETTVSDSHPLIRRCG